MGVEVARKRQFHAVRVRQLLATQKYLADEPLRNRVDKVSEHEELGAERRDIGSGQITVLKNLERYPLLVERVGNRKKQSLGRPTGSATREKTIKRLVIHCSPDLPAVTWRNR